METAKAIEMTPWIERELLALTKEIDNAIENISKIGHEFGYNQETEIKEEKKETYSSPIDNALKSLALSIRDLSKIIDGTKSVIYKKDFGIPKSIGK